ncbi:hypothetical protein [Pseudomonas oryzihabitans]|uniref:hypothetical protein n=1 Tax=Pseudomonas oryzihabitans TaxID=47885 RepID=UPI001DEE0F3D|nr:hypothetical protein [Pseudomonas oryzihabitans]HJE71442.1 hypothetical protein [Pseudomonas oryzihabitans]
MNDEQFELTISDLAGSGTYYADIADELRARDIAQREALARMKADHEANGLEYGEALILIGQVLDCRSLEDLNAVRRYLNEFMDRYSLRPVPDVDLFQAEQQEAQGAQASEFQREDRYIVIKRKDLEKVTTPMAFSLGELLNHLPKRECLVIESDWPEYERTWADIQARVEGRAALATQPAAGEPVAWQWRSRIKGGAWDAWENGRYDFEPAPFMDVEHRGLYAAPPAAAHGDEAVRKDATESAIQRACNELPEGWSMQIELERGAGDVTLFNAWDIVVDFGQDFESSISEQVEAAIDAAMRAQGE